VFRGVEECGYLILITLDRHECFSVFHHLQKDKQCQQRHSLKLGKKIRESSKRNYYIISPRVIIKAIIIKWLDRERRLSRCLPNTSTFVPNDRSQCLDFFLPIMRCTFGAHLDVGFAERQTPCRFVEISCFLPSFLGKMTVFDKTEPLEKESERAKENERCSKCQAIYIYMYVYMYMCVCVCVHTHTHTRTHTNTYRHTHTHIHTHTRIHTHKHTHKHAYTRIHTNKHIHTYTNA